ncbi:succinate-semialdehyde dehydrogenase/glutarate-semialdehyde dehydrogenase [Kitasatospora sp. GAS204A]|uniref:NAD-dependent succinate-semialdehyde dehydrogenase n=1 Tax=unclassified Kitasatospora TaxID=2633591 RepID=UPI0024762F3D|nr:NAD-dependent succinate-semialdehyde dehydrogenase [Kitasatospora sp. GAS204B]MDH6121410.1 succinate-semialdehyde dehydrogenase/glutarate-semialdehyde dehydrogenase [Kitasatospora sp. GAS204B]
MESTNVVTAPTGVRDLYIDGARTAAIDGRSYPVVDPATAKVLCDVSSGGAADAAAAVDAAAAAFPRWRTVAPRQRAEILRRAYDLMLSRSDPLARLMVSENGKSLRDAKGEIGYAAEFFRWYSEEAVRIGSGFGDSPAGGFRHVIRRQPVGVTAHVTPWNLPAAMVARKVAPALAAGCTVVLKPAPETPLTALAIAEILAEAGLPAGALNVVPTDRAPEVVGVWMDDERVRKFSFTGSTGTGRLLLEQAARTVKNTTMELGGNAPFIVLADADVDAAVRGAMDAKMRGGGEVCIAANRFYVHEDVAEEFTRKFGEAMAAVRIGPGLAEGVELGAMVNQAAIDRIGALVADAVERGASIAAQGPTPEGPGYFHPATVLTGVTPDARIMHEEVFGPVAPIAVFRDEEEVLAAANNTPFGLAAYVFSGDLGRALRLAERIESGMVGVNRGLLSDPAAPFGGVKQSGLGREGAQAGIEAFLETQYLAVEWPAG